MVPMKKNSKVNVLFLATFVAGSLVMASACSDDDNDNIPDEIQKTGDVVELEGTWVTGCMENTILELSHTRRQYEFSLNRNFAKIEFLYDNENCENQLIEYRVEGNYRTDRVADEQGLEGKPIDFEIEKASITPYNETAVDILNGIEFCGISDWAAAQAREITNVDCMGFTNNEGETIFEIYEIRNDNQLLFGKNFLFLQETDSAERPTELDEEVIYQHQ